MIFLAYNILLTFFLLLAIPYVLLRSLVQKRFRTSLLQRMGFFRSFSLHRPIWVHAASVGEVFCSIPLLKKIRKEFPHLKIILTTMTSMGKETAQTYLPEADQVLFVPMDHPFIVRRTLKKIQPRLLLIAETELWPNLLCSFGKRKIPIILFNGRISEKSFRGYLFLKFLFKECLKYVSLFLMQTQEDQTRIIEMGANPDKTRVVGNLKFDQPFPSLPPESMNELAKTLGLSGKENVLIAGSTHSGEEEILVTLFKELKKKDPNLVLLLAPRHLERLEEVEKILKRESLSWQRKTFFSLSRSQSDQEPSQVILLDTMGELMRLYCLGSLVFVGGSLVPVGGHNPLEPLFFKKCVFFGPYMFNFLEISRRLTEAGGAIWVSGKEDLFSQMNRLVFDEAARKEVGEKGYQFLQKHQGATERMLKEIKPFLREMSE